jgi:hypothetical protein
MTATICIPYYIVAELQSIPTAELLPLLTLFLNFAIGGFVVTTNYRLKKVERAVKTIRIFLAGKSNFNVDIEDKSLDSINT